MQRYITGGISSLNNDKRLLAEVAYQYYVEDMTQTEISRLYNIGRSTISRMLKEAREENIVEITIKSFNPEVVKIKKQLLKKYKLDYLEISTNDGLQTEEEKDHILAEIAGDSIRNLIDDNQNIGMAWGNTLSQTIKYMRSKKIENSRLVPIVGGPVSNNVHTHVNTIIYEMASKTGGTPYYINASAVQESRKIKEGIIQSLYFNETITNWSELDIAIVGVGGILSSSMNNWRNLLTEKDYELLKLDGAIGDICCRFINRNGEVLKGDLHDRTIGIEIEKLRQVPTRLAIARGKDKNSAIKALLKTNTITALITDLDTAKKL